MTHEVAHTPARAHSSRAEQRRQTECRILEAARKLFAESGYDRATIRAIATEAETDPGLVMRYFGSKESLFTKVLAQKADEPVGTNREEVVETQLETLRNRLDGDGGASMAMLRSMLTHPEANREVRTVFAQRQRRVAATLDTDRAELRAALIGAVTVGTLISFQMLEFEGLRGADLDDIIDVLRPALHTMLGEPTTQ